MSINYFQQPGNLGLTYPNNAANFNYKTDKEVRNKMYLNELKDQMKEHPKLNKVEEYSKKMIEREEMNKLFSYNPFGKPGNGAPNIENNAYNTNQSKLGDMSKVNSYPGNYNNYNSFNNKANTVNYHQNPIPPIMKESSYDPQLMNRITNNNERRLSSREFSHRFDSLSNYPDMNRYDSYKKNNNANFSNTQIDNKYDQLNFTQNNTNKKFNETENLYNNNNYNSDRNSNHDDKLNYTSTTNNIATGIHIDSQNKNQKQINIINYQNELKSQIEEKKRKQDDEKRNQIKLDLLEEENYKQFLLKKKEQDEDQKVKRKGNKFPSIQDNQETTNSQTYANKYKNMNNSPPRQTKEKEYIEVEDIDSNRQFLSKNPKTKFYQESQPQDDELQSYQQMIGLTYENLRQNIQEDANEQLNKIKSEVSRQYNEMNEMFNKLKMEVKDASNLKFDAERELNKIREEIERKKVTNVMYENKLNSVLEKHAPYNNVSIPINEVHPLFMPTKDSRKRHLNLESTTTMVYNRQEYTDETNIGGNKSKLSNLAQRGQDLIGVSEFVPITNNSYSIENRNKQFNNDENVFIMNEKMDGMYNTSTNTDEYPDMYAKLDKIQALNNKLNPLKRYQKIKNNHMQDLSHLDKFLQEVNEFDKITTNKEREGSNEKGAYNFHEKQEIIETSNEDTNLFDQ